MKILLLALIITLLNSSIEASTFRIHILPPQKKKLVPKEVEKKDLFFIGLSSGIAKFDVSEKNFVGNLELDAYSKDAGVTYGIAVGHYINNNIFSTLNYQRTNLKNIHFNSTFVSLNYKFTDTKVLFPYVGALLGFSVINWETLPLNTSASKKESFSFLRGLELGSDIPIKNHFSFYVFYRYLWINDATTIEITPDKKEITHKHEQNLNIGVKFSF